MELKHKLMAPIKALMSKLNLSKKFTIVVTIILLSYIPPSTYVFNNLREQLTSINKEIIGIQYLKKLQEGSNILIQGYNSFNEGSSFISNAQSKFAEIDNISDDKEFSEINSEVQQLSNQLVSLKDSKDDSSYKTSLDILLTSIQILRNKILSKADLNIDPTAAYYLIDATSGQMPILTDKYAQLNYPPTTTTSNTSQQSQQNQLSVQQQILAKSIEEILSSINDDFSGAEAIGQETKEYVSKSRPIVATILASIKQISQGHIDVNSASSNLNNINNMAYDGLIKINSLLEQRKDHAVNMVWLISILLIISVILVLYCIIGFIESIKHPMHDLTQSIQLIASGKLVSEIPTYGKDEFHALLVQLSEMQNDLFLVIQQINEVSGTLNCSAQEIASGNSDLSERTQEQASCLVETASSLNNLTMTIKKNADSAKDAADQSNSATLIAQKGGEAVNQVITTMADINESAQKIQEITGVIDGIAFQTNLLALNASVEAARAGEQGRGFAVVAAEVRNLAQRSAEAAKQIKSLINDSMTKVASGDAQVKVTFTTMQEIVSSIESVNSIIGKIAIASNEQSSSIEEINVVISQLEGNTQKNAAQVEEVAASAELLKEQSNRLVTIVNKFDIGDSDEGGSIHALENTHKVEDSRKIDKAKASKNSAIKTTASKNNVSKVNNVKQPTSKSIPVNKSKSEPKPTQPLDKSREKIVSPKRHTQQDTSVLDDENSWKEF